MTAKVGCHWSVVVASSFILTGAPRYPAVSGLREEYICLVATRSIVRVGHIDVAVDGVDHSMRKLIAAKNGIRGGALAKPGQAQIAVCTTDQAGGDGHGGPKCRP